MQPMNHPQMIPLNMQAVPIPVHSIPVQTIPNIPGMVNVNNSNIYLYCLFLNLSSSVFNFLMTVSPCS